MKFTSTIVLALAGFAVAKGGKNNKGNSTRDATSTKSQCKQVSKLTQITDLAANATKLAQKADNNATLIAEFQAKAATAATKLSTLSSNATLMAECNVIFAEEDMVNDCETMAKIEIAQEIVNNATMLAKFTDNNATMAAAFQAKVAAKQADLSALDSNATLTAFCAARDTMSSCKSLAKLSKQQALAANTTALSAKFEKSDNATKKIAKFQAQVAEKATKMADMMTNTTLLDTCASMGITVAATTSAATNSTSSDTSSDTKNAAGMVTALTGGQVVALVSAVVCALTML